MNSQITGQAAGGCTPDAGCKPEPALKELPQQFGPLEAADAQTGSARSSRVKRLDDNRNLSRLKPDGFPVRDRVLRRKRRAALW